MIDEKEIKENEVKDDVTKEKSLPKYEVKKNKSVFKDSVAPNEIQLLQDNYVNEIYTSSKYSLEVDPDNIYNMTETQKNFIRNYCEYNNIPLAAQLSEIDEKEALILYRMISTQSEIKRIRLARYHRNFAAKMLNLDEIGGYLTSLIVDEVPMSDRINTANKLKVIDMLIRINDMKTKIVNDPTIIDTIPIEEQLKELSLASIQNMINASTGNTAILKQFDNKKEDIICQIQDKNGEKLSIEELSELRSMSYESLLELLDSMSEEK